MIPAHTPPINHLWTEMAILKANVYSATQNSKAASPVAPATSVIDVVKLTSLKTIFVCIVILIEKSA